MAAKKKFSFKNLFSNNNFVLLFSVIAAIVLWMIITINESPDSENTISGINVSIPVENSVVSELGLSIIDDVSKYNASVTVTGPAYVVSAVTASDITVTASVSRITSSGTYALELRAAKQTSGVKGDFEISSISPSEITVTFDYIDTKEFEVVAQADGASAVKGLIAEPAVVSDSNNAKLTFKGPRSEISKINKVVALSKVNKELSKTETFLSELKIYDESGNELPLKNYTITAADGTQSPDIQISVPISKIKTVPIKAQFINYPAAYNNKAPAHSLSYSNIDIIGPAESIDSISSIMLESIDFFNISRNNQEFTVKPVIPDGIRSVDNIDSVNVKITGLDKYVIKTYTVSKLTVKDSAGNATLTRSIRNVKIIGPKSVLNNLPASSLYAEIDIVGKEKGVHTVAVTVKCQTSDLVWQVGTYTASVNIE